MCVLCTGTQKYSRFRIYRYFLYFATTHSNSPTHCKLWHSTPAYTLFWPPSIMSSRRGKKNKMMTQPIQVLFKHLQSVSTHLAHSLALKRRWQSAEWACGFAHRFLHSYRIPFPLLFRTIYLFIFPINVLAILTLTLTVKPIFSATLTPFSLHPCVSVWIFYAENQGKSLALWK